MSAYNYFITHYNLINGYYSSHLYSGVLNNILKVDFDILKYIFSVLTTESVFEI